jgi:hypothetical protein
MNCVLVNDGQPPHESACGAAPGHSGQVTSGTCRRGSAVVTMSAIGNASSAALMSWPFSQLRTVSTSKGVPRLDGWRSRRSPCRAPWPTGAAPQTWTVLQSLTQAFLSAHELMTLEGGDS